MMDPVRILDNYRISLISNRDSIQLLALLLRDGPKMTPDLVKNIGIEKASLDRLLISLFRAAFIEQQKTDFWAISDLGERILDGLQIVDLASEDLANSLADEPVDKLYIKDWFQRSNKERDSKNCLTLLRSLRLWSEIETPKVAPKKKSSFVYSIFIATDPWARQTGIENAAEYFSRRLKSRLLSNDPSSSVELEVKLDSIKKTLKKAEQTYQQSNRVFLFMPSTPPASTSDEILEFTWLRALDAALEGSADQGLRASCHAWNRTEASTFWEYMFTNKYLEQHSRKLFELSSGIYEASSKKLLEELTERLFEAVTSEPQSRQNEPAFLGPTKKQDEFDTLVHMIKDATKRFREEGKSSVPQERQDKLKSALRDLRSILEENETIPAPK